MSFYEKMNSKPTNTENPDGPHFFNHPKFNK